MATRPTNDTSWTEPPSGFDAHAPLTHVLETESGHFQIFDDTPEHEIIRTQHRTGTFTEIQPDGSEIHKIMGNNYEIVARDNNVLIKGVCNVTIEGDSIMHVKGDAYTQVDGKAKILSKNDISVSSTDGKIEITGNEQINLFAGSATGSINIRAAEAVNINSDLNVSGSIISKQSISAIQNVSAGLKLGAFAGAEIVGPIICGTQVFAPWLQGMITYDAFGSMYGIRQTHQAHIHKAPFGLTTPPITPPVLDAPPPAPPITMI